MGITPAGAGKTKMFNSNIKVKLDHPRRCGENYLFRFYMTPSEGSPPQVRGKPVTSALIAIAVRITPAGAGKTVRSRCDSFG